MQALATRTWSREARHHPGQVAWSARHAQGDDQGADSGAARLWREDGVVAGWAWAEQPTWLELCVDRDHPWVTDIARDAVAWFLARAPDLPTRTMVLRSEHHLLDVLNEAGFIEAGVVEKGVPWFTYHHLELDRLPEVPTTPGYRLRPIEPDEAAPRAACHRAAWSAPGQPSRVTTTSYAALMRTPPYRSDLDWVALAPDGAWVGSCLVWLDPTTEVALVEPVGCAPDHRRNGLASAVSIAALHAARNAGAREALVCPRGDRDYLAPQALYQGMGFEPGERTVTLVREP